MHRGLAPRHAPCPGTRLHGCKSRVSQVHPHHVYRRHLSPPLPAAATAEPATSAFKAAAAVDILKKLSALTPSLSSAKVEPKLFISNTGPRVGLIARQDCSPGQVVLTIPESLSVTSIDAEKHPLVGDVAAECSELVAMSLWLLAERAQGTASANSALLQSLPETTLSPLVWSEAELAELLRGSPALAEARKRIKELKGQWAQLQETHFSNDTSRYSPAVFNEEAFMRAFSVVIAHSVYLPSASCFALLPLASVMGRTGGETGCSIDYDADSSSVVVTAPRRVTEGAELQLYDPRPNSELLLSTGVVQDKNPADFITFDACLVPSDRYYTMKNQILEAMGFSAQQEFPVYQDRFPNQLLSYLRLSRVSDPGLFAKVSFDTDVVLSQVNEYEILQILMGDCRERLAAYAGNLEEDVKMLQLGENGPRAVLANKQRLNEKRILSATMDAVRKRLAPIRGIPTKGGNLQDPNSDLKEIFDVIESIPVAPQKLFGGLMSWARGDDDPDWKKKKPGARK